MVSINDWKYTLNVYIWVQKDQGRIVLIAKYVIFALSTLFTVPFDLSKLLIKNIKFIGKKHVSWAANIAIPRGKAIKWRNKILITSNMNSCIVK